MKSSWSEDEFKFIELLKTKDVYEAEKIMGWTRGYGYRRLQLMRQKIEKAHNTVNIANNWKDSKKNPRAAKLLRRARNVE